MSGYINHTSEFSEPQFGNAWRDSAGQPRGSVNFGPTWVIFDSAAQARAAGAACLQAADAIFALPPAEGSQS